MNLTLEVISANGSALGAGRRKVFGSEGGRIGRSPECDWTLPSPNKFISRHQATILCRDGQFYVKAEGGSGVALNDPGASIPFGAPSRVNHGDRLYIDEYEILASLAGASAQPARSADPFAAPAGGAVLPPLIGSLDDDPIGDPSLDPLAALDPLSVLPGPAIRPERDRGYGAMAQGSVLNDPFIPPPVAVPPAVSPPPPPRSAVPSPAPPPAPPPAAPPRVAAAARPAAPSEPASTLPRPIAPLIPSDWNQTTFGKSVADDPLEAIPRPVDTAPPLPRPAPPVRPAIPEARRTPAAPAPTQRVAPTPPAAPRIPVPPPQPAAAKPATPPAPRAAATPAPTPVAAAASIGGLDLDALLRGAGVDPANVPPEFAATLGQILRLAVQGTIDALRARDELKSQFRLAVTRVKVADNNPLSFAVDADDALNAMLNRRNPAYLGPAEAFARAFDDIREHQMAMLAGMRAGFENLMARFDPAELQRSFDKQSKRGGLLGAVSSPKYWDLYADHFQALQGDRDDAFRRLFGEEFAAAYEKQIELLKRSRGRKIPS
jgi:type VI secretion system FHA domain protein